MVPTLRMATDFADAPTCLTEALLAKQQKAARSAVMQPPLPWDSAEIRAVLDRPASFYHEYARRPNVAAALQMFRSERDVHQTERLDLVTWVQYICGFGCIGPSEDAWTQLFLACRFPQQLSVSADSSSEDLSTGDFLKEHEIAVLLAHAKVSPEASDAMTHAALIKHRIRPAVFGRNDARTPGIIRHVCAKFEDWIFGYMTRWMCHYIVQEFSPSSFLSGFDDINMFSADAQHLKNCADAHAAKNVKDWGDVVMHLLEIDDNTISARALRFEQKVAETRVFLYLQFYSKISEYWLNSFQNGAGLLPVEEKPRHYRAIALPSPNAQDTLIFAAGTESNGGPRLTSRTYSMIKWLCSARHIPRPIFGHHVVESYVTLFELHAPRMLGEAGLEFLPVDDVRPDSVTACSEADLSALRQQSFATVRLGSFRSPLLMSKVYAAPLSQCCRALVLALRAAVLPKKKGNGLELRVVDIGQARWVELEGSDDCCEELEPIREMGMEFDEDSEDSELSEGTEEKRHKLKEDPLHTWLRKSDVAAALEGAESCRWKIGHVCNGFRKYAYSVEVPKSIVAKVRPEAVVTEAVTPESFSDSDSETMLFNEHCWIDCHTGAQSFFKVHGGIELSAISPYGKYLFDKAPAWRWRPS